MPAFGPFADALGPRCDGPLLANSRVSPWPPIAAAERLGCCREGQLTGAAANSHYRPTPDVRDSVLARGNRPDDGRSGRDGAIALTRAAATKWPDQPS